MTNPERTATCDCGKARVQVKEAPLTRIICHCTICQAYHRAPTGDLLIFRGRALSVQDASSIDYRRLRKPPAVDRGNCRHCDAPIVEFLQMPLFPRLGFVPASRLGDQVTLPPPQVRVFYDSRIADIDADVDANGGIPRYAGYWPSQLAMMRCLLPALLRGPREP